MSATGSRVESGFTLLELLVVLALIALVAGALPLALRQLMPGQQLKVATADLAAELRALQAKAALTGAIQEFRIERAMELPSGVDLELTAQGGAAQIAAIAFHPDGSTSGGRLTLVSGERRRSLEVSPLTGRIRAVEP